MKMATTANIVAEVTHDGAEKPNVNLENFDVKKALEEVTAKIASLDKKIQTEEPFKVIKVDEVKGKVIIKELLTTLHEIVCDLEIFLPKTSAKILECIRENKMPEKPLFGRLS
jgi:methionyl-tRNA synthetase